MQFYYLIIGLMAMVGAVLHLCLKKENHARKAFCLYAFAVLGTVSAIRYSVGVDYSYIYAPLYEAILADPLGPFSQSVHEPGFVLLEKIIALITKNYQALFVVTSFLIIGLVMLYYYKYSANAAVSVFLFLTLSQYYCSMNFIRQTLAAAIALFAIDYMKRRKFWRYCLLVLLAATMHTSALMLIPFYFVNLIQITGYTLLLYLPLTCIIYLNSGGALTFVTQHVYQYYDADSPHIAQGFPVGFFLIAAFCFLFLLITRKWLVRKDPRNYIYLNYAFFSMVFIFLGTKHTILDRLSLYFEIALPVGISIAVAELCKDLPPLKKWRSVLKGTARSAKRKMATAALLLLVVLGGSMAAHHYAINKDFHGVVPYQIIFDQPFYAEYVESLKNG